MRSRVDGRRRADRRSGGELHPPGPQNPLPIFFLEHLTPLEDRRPPSARAGHPNRVVRTERAYVAVPDVAAAAQSYARVLGMAVPPIQRGNVIKADMAVFDLGPTGLAVAQPARAGSGRRSSVALWARAVPGVVPHERAWTRPRAG